MSPDQARTHAAATIAAQAGDLRTGHDGPTGWLVAELDMARQTIRAQRRRIADLERQVDDLNDQVSLYRTQRAAAAINKYGGQA